VDERSVEREMTHGKMLYFGGSQFQKAESAGLDVPSLSAAVYFRG
jgi:hypothetical protein